MLFHNPQSLPILLALTVLLAACNPEVPALDTKKPTLAEVTAVPYGKDTTPDYTFSSSEAGTITYGGGCSSLTTNAVKGNNTITFSALDYGVYSSCTIKVKDAANNTSATLAITTFTISMVTPRPLNDTGITTCGDYAAGYSANHNNDMNCTTAGSTKTTAGTDSDGDPVPAGQDAVHGRDANPATNSDTDGHKGFSFTKLKADGAALAIQSGSWSDAGSEAAGTKWSCVQDNVTGLIWEVKTNDSGLRDKDWTYSWYNNNSASNGGSAGTADGGNNCFATTRCDTEKYVADVNAATLCGSGDWRVPTKAELKTLRKLDSGSPAIDSNFIPNTISSTYWSASPYAGNSSNAWFVHFTYGVESNGGKSGSAYVRLVRGGP